MPSINYNFRVDENLKNRAFAVIESYGLTPAQAFKMFLNQIADTQSIPLSLNYRMPNTQTLAAMEQARHNRKTGNLGKGYADLGEMLRDLQSEE